MAFSNPVEAAAVLTSEEFTSRLVEVADFTADTNAEAGFAVYKRADSDEPSYSNVLHPDETYLEAMARMEEEGLHSDLTGAQLARLIEEMHEGTDIDGVHPSLHLGRLITDEGFNDTVVTDTDAWNIAEQPMSMRTDLAVVTHSHPLLHLRHRDPRQFLLPSAADLISHGDQMAHNPGVMNAVTVTHQKLGGTALLIWRAQGPETQAKLQALPQGSHITESRLAELGLQSATLVYNRHTGQIRSGLKQIPNLF